MVKNPSAVSSPNNNNNNEKQKQKTLNAKALFGEIKDSRMG